MAIARKGLSIAAVLVAVLGLSAAWAQKNAQGYCLSSMRRLSEGEQIDIAVAHVMKAIGPGGKTFAQVGGEIKEIEDPRKYNRAYTSVAEFRADNPNCCRLTRTNERIDHQPSAWYTWTGRFLGFVEIKFKDARRKADGSIEHVENISYLALTNCGEVWSGI